MEKDILRLLELPFPELISLANSTRNEHAGKHIDLCSIMNAKSGMCAQDCKFCAQSARHSTGINTYSLKKREEMLELAQKAKAIGADRFDIVTSGNSLSADEFALICEAIREIKHKIGIKLCASLGKLSEKQLSQLKESGLTRYHHNLETSRRYFPQIVSTHSFDDRVETIKAVKKVGLEACSGGIIGMGESMEDRISLALTLEELGVDSVPINILVPIKGTPLGERPLLSCTEAIRTVAIFRIILKEKTIKVAAGRESVLKDFQAMAFMAGANGMLIGGYLTIKGRSVDEDWKLVEEVKKLWQD
ncbi:MAG: biotin synthase BioB [Candidatus Omnitrophota bacterium]|nr:biotin synthase BioB [Candidatus Omnitrophota bacterium]